MLHRNYKVFLYRTSTDLWVLLISNFRNHLESFSLRSKFSMAIKGSCLCTSEFLGTLAGMTTGEPQSPHLMQSKRVWLDCLVASLVSVFSLCLSISDAIFWGHWIMRRILDAIYDFLVMLMFVTGVAICQGLTSLLNSLQSYWETESIIIFNSAGYFFCIVFWKGYYVY